MPPRYSPVVASQPPLAISARKFTGLAIKPSAYQLPGDTTMSFLFFSPSSGYTTIYAEKLNGRSKRPVVQGERSEQFESFHFFESRIDVNRKGVAAFSSKYAERDALFFWDLRRGKVVGRYQFPELVSILSPAWAPAGDSATTPPRIYFSSDRDGSFQAYSIDLTGAGRRETKTFNGAFDPQWIPGEGTRGELLFGGFADLSFNIYVAPPVSDVTTTFALPPAESLPAPSWTWGELSHPQYARADGAPYERKFSLDFAAGEG